MTSEDITRRLIDMQENQSAVLSALTDAINRLADNKAVPAPDTSAIDELDAFIRQKMANLNSVDVSTSPVDNIYTKELIVENGKQYQRQTHPLLFSVVDYLETHEDARNASVRKIAELVSLETKQSVGKSWAAVAKNYWQNKK